MKTPMLVSGALVAIAMSAGANAYVLSITGYGGFALNSDREGGPVPTGYPPLTYYACEDDPICTSISWGTPTVTGGPFGGQSGASINASSAPDVFALPSDNAIVNHPNTLGELFVLGTLTHFNEPITGDPNPADPGYSFLIDVNYKIEIDKYDDEGNFVGRYEDMLPFGLTFFETRNELPCDDTANLVDSVCDDTFEYFGDEKFPFQIAGQKYYIEVIGFCTDDSLDSCSPDGILYTAEGETTTGFVLEIKEAPAPGALALVSAGLFGIAFARRRAKA